MSASACADILDAWILAENKIVTYRLLSRLLKVSCNEAKKLMAEWHAQRRNSHATYVLCGHREERGVGHGQGISHAPVVDSSSDPITASTFSQVTGSIVRSKVIQLVPEEDLESVKAEFQDISGCHIYSLEPGRLSDISIVTACEEDVREAMKGQSTKMRDLSDTYGLIFNAIVHELDSNPRKPAVPDRLVKPIFKKAEPIAVTEIKPEIKKEISTGSNASNGMQAPAAQKPPALKRNASSSLASAFAKTQKPKPKVKAETSVQEQPAREQSSTVMAETEQQSAKHNHSLSSKTKIPEKTLKEKEALRAMMMEDDVEFIDQPANNPIGNTSILNVLEPGDAEMLDADDWSASETEAQGPAGQEVARADTADEVPPKRRTKKKIKRQVHSTDAKGYMVTKEVWEWVSCDEEEEEPNPPARPLAAKPGTNPVKAKTMPKKKLNGGGGIASYFQKKA